MRKSRNEDKRTRTARIKQKAKTVIFVIRCSQRKTARILPQSERIRRAPNNKGSMF